MHTGQDDEVLNNNIDLFCSQTILEFHVHIIFIQKESNLLRSRSIGTDIVDTLLSKGTKLSD